jgi:hypothetical protein
VRAAVVSVGIACALGEDPAAVAGRAGGAAPQGPAVPCDVDVGPFVRRRKDARLLARPARLLLVAVARALGGSPPGGCGLFVGVGEEPPTDELEPALIASERAGELDVALLGHRGLALMPPLASLLTLPNLALAHTAIQLGIDGPTGTCAGGATAGIAALREAIAAVHEGRCALAVAAATDSFIAPSQVRDLRRRGLGGPGGEAAAAVVVARVEARDRPVLGASPVRRDCGPPTIPPHRASLGWCGAADGLLELVLARALTAAGELRIADETGRSAAVCWAPATGDP